MPLPPLRYYQFSERGRAMPSQSSNPKKPRIRNLKKIQAEQLKKQQQEQENAATTVATE